MKLVQHISIGLDPLLETIPAAVDLVVGDTGVPPGNQAPTKVPLQCVEATIGALIVRNHSGVPYPISNITFNFLTVFVDHLLGPYEIKEIKGITSSH